MSLLPHHNRYTYSPLVERPVYSWPGGKRLAIYVCIAAEHFAYGAGGGEDYAAVNVPADDRNYAWRDYGQRIGLWRLLELVDELGLPATFAMNSSLFDMQPRIAERLVKRGDEIVAHGRTSSESLAGLWAADEAAAVEQVTRIIKEKSGARPMGWSSPAFVESGDTIDILARAGYQYVLDWPADDQPFWIEASNGRILSIPFPLEMNDTTVMTHRHQTARQFAELIVSQFEEMIEECGKRPLVMPIALHPYIAGQPFRVHALRKALQHCLESRFQDRIWLTRSGEIARHCLALPGGTVP